MRTIAALYYSANGAGWVNASGWNVTTTPCSWYGVSCDTGHVVALSLPSNQLRGMIPRKLGDLSTRLQTLILSSSALLSGTLPHSLTTLHLNRFWFDGTTLCEPPNVAFQSWLAGIGDLRRTGVLCRILYAPIADIVRGSAFGLHREQTTRSTKESTGGCSEWMAHGAVLLVSVHRSVGV